MTSGLRATICEISTRARQKEIEADVRFSTLFPATRKPRGIDRNSSHKHCDSLSFFPTLRVFASKIRGGPSILVGLFPSVASQGGDRQAQTCHSATLKIPPHTGLLCILSFRIIWSMRAREAAPAVTNTLTQPAERPHVRRAGRVISLIIRAATAAGDSVLFTAYTIQSLSPGQSFTVTHRCTHLPVIAPGWPLGDTACFDVALEARLRPSTPPHLQPRLPPNCCARSDPGGSGPFLDGV